MGLSDKDIVALSGGHTLVTFSDIFNNQAEVHHFFQTYKHIVLALLSCYFLIIWFCREEHIKIGQDLMVPGQVTRSSLTTHTLCNT